MLAPRPAAAATSAPSPPLAVRVGALLEQQQPHRDDPLRDYPGYSKREHYQNKGIFPSSLPPPLPPLPAFPRVFVVRGTPVWRGTLRERAPARPATRVFIDWLDFNNLSVPAASCAAAAFALLPTGCTSEPESIAELLAEGAFANEQLAAGSGASPDLLPRAAEVAAEVACLRSLIAKKRIVSGICCGDNGYNTELGGELRPAVVRVSMNGLRSGRRAACEPNLLCKGFLDGEIDVAVPGQQLRGRDEDIFDALGPAAPGAPRHSLMYFAGSARAERPGQHTEGANLRRRVQEYFANEPGFNFTRFAGRGYPQAMAEAEFCLAPLGMHGGWGSRWKQAVMMGCIPVMLDEGHLQPLEPLFAKRRYGVALRYRDLPDLPAILRAVPEPERRRKRRKILRMRASAMWSQQLPYAIYRLLCARFGLELGDEPDAAAVAAAAAEEGWEDAKGAGEWWLDQDKHEGADGTTTDQP